MTPRTRTALYVAVGTLAAVLIIFEAVDREYTALVLTVTLAALALIGLSA